MKAIDELVDDGLRLYRDTLSQTLVPAALGALIGGIPVAMVLADGPQPPQASTIDWSAFGLALLFQAVVNLTVQGMLLKIMALRARNGVNLEASEAFHAGVAMLPSMFIAAVIYFLCFAALCLLLVLPGIWILVAGALAPTAIALEGRDPLAAIKRSVALVRGKWWRTFGLLMLAGMVMILGYLLCAALVKPLADAAFGGGWPTEAALTTVIGAVFTPMFNALMVIVFLDYAGGEAGAPETQRADRIAA